MSPNKMIESDAIQDENMDPMIDSNFIVSGDVRFNDEPLTAEPKERKRRREDEAEKERKRLVKERYDKEMHEQRYKRLMHLLNQSKFYASYIVDKINTPAEDEQKNNERNKTPEAKKKTPLQEKKNNKKAKPNNQYNIREYIPQDVGKKLIKQKLGKQKSPRQKLNLSDEEITDQLNTDSDTEKENNDLPVYFNGILRDYQRKGFDWLKVLYENGLNGILADEMGLGKTVQIIALLCHLVEKQQDGPYLIVAPLSTVPNWMLEFERFAPKLPLVVYHGSRDDRFELRKKIKQFYQISGAFKTQPIVLTSFETPLVEQSFLGGFHWRYIIVDEGHRLKNHESQLCRVLKTFNSMNRVLMTGTPLQNNLAELWSLLNFLLPEIFDDLAVFESWFDINDLQYDPSEKLLKQEEESHVITSLREILRPFMLRRVKSDVCLDVPPKKEVLVHAPLTQLQHDLYKAVLNRDVEKFLLAPGALSEVIPDDENGRRRKRQCVLRSRYNVDDQPAGSPNTRSSRSPYVAASETKPNDRPSQVDKSLTMWKQYVDVTDRNRDFFVRLTMQNTMTMYKKIVNHPHLVYCPLDDTGLPKVDKTIITNSGKLMVLDAMLAKLYKRGHKVLLFSTMTMILNIIEDYLTLRDYTYVRLDGSHHLEERKKNIKRFNEDPNVFLFLISTRAGGVGLNLSAADTVIMYDSDWNPQADIQAMARCHRIGQTRPVVIYKLCTKGTIDEKIIMRGEAKRMLEKMVISEKIPGIYGKETLKEMKRLLESKECQVVTSEKAVFTEAELDKLLDRSDLMKN